MGTTVNCALLLPGSSGAPVMILNNPPNDDEETNGPGKGRPNVDIIIGVVSFANYSSLEESGIGCVSISNVQDWIKTIIPKQVPMLNKESVFVSCDCFIPLSFPLGADITGMTSLMMQSGNW